MITQRGYGCTGYPYRGPTVTTWSATTPSEVQDRVSPAERAERGSYVGCMGGPEVIVPAG